MAHSITSIDGDEDKEKVRKFVRDELYAIDSRALPSTYENSSA
jgi:hypothetical protein